MNVRPLVSYQQHDSHPGGAAASTQAARARKSTRTRPDLLSYLVAGMILTYVWRLHDLYPALGRIKVLAILSVLAGLAWLVSSDRRRRLKRIATPAFLFLVGLFALMIIGLPLSLWPGGSFTFLRQEYIKIFFFLIVTAASIRGLGDAEFYAKALVLGGLVFSVTALMRWDVGASWRWGDMVYYDANDFAFVLVCTMPFVVYFLRKGTPSFMRLLAFASLLLFVIALARSGSRGGFLGLLAVAVYISIVFRAIPTKVRITAAVVGTSALLLFASAEYWTQMRTLLNPTEDYNWSSETGRRNVWKRGIGYMLGSPILGVGVDQFYTAEGRLSDIAQARSEVGSGFKWSAPHNSFIQVGAELGVTGLVLFLGAIIASIVAMSRIRRSPFASGRPGSPEEALGQAVIGGLIAFCVAGFFLTQAYSLILHALLALAIGMAKSYPVPKRMRSRRRRAVMPNRVLPQQLPAHYRG
jgi:O-antigen ligase